MADELDALRVSVQQKDAEIDRLKSRLQDSELDRMLLQRNLDGALEALDLANRVAKQAVDYLEKLYPNVPT